MLKQSPSRNQRTKGFKLKQGFKIFILIAVGIWLLYQLKHSHDDKNKAGNETKSLGRKGFHPLIKKPYELIDDTDESKPGMVREQSGGGDDDIIGHHRDRVEEEEPEEVEDLIDEEDKEKEEENEDEDSEAMGKQIEDENLLEDQGHSEGEKDTQATGEKPHRMNGASMRFGGLRKIKEEGAENSEKQLKKMLSPSTNLSPEDGVLNFADSGRGSNSDSLLDTEFD